MLIKKPLTREVDLLIFELGGTKILSHSCQLFKKDGLYGYSPYGSGVCVKISEQHFVFTASHVSDFMEEDQTLYVKGKSSFIPIAGNIRQTDIVKDKNVDLAYIKLDNQTLGAFKVNHEFLPINKIIGRHKLLDAAQYMVLGFPEKNIRVNNGEVSTGASSYLLCPSKEKVYKYYKLNPDLFISLEFSGKGIDLQTGEKSKTRELYGISGCGVWLIDVIQTGEDISVDYSLVGIMLGGFKGKYHIIFANKIDILMQSMIQFGDINVKPKI